MMREADVCEAEMVLSTSDEGTIYKSHCGNYHVHVGAVTLHLTPYRFDAMARLFKLAFGMMAVRQCLSPNIDPIHQCVEGRAEKRTEERTKPEEKTEPFFSFKEENQRHFKTENLSEREKIQEEILV